MSGFLLVVGALTLGGLVFIGSFAYITNGGAIMNVDAPGEVDRPVRGSSATMRLWRTVWKPALIVGLVCFILCIVTH